MCLGEVHLVPLLCKMFRAAASPSVFVSMVYSAEHNFLTHSIQSREEVTFPGFVDCIYLGAPSEVILDNGLGNKIAISNSKCVEIWKFKGLCFDIVKSTLFRLSFCNAVGQMQSCGIPTCRWRPVTKILSVWKTQRYYNNCTT